MNYLYRILCLSFILVVSVNSQAKIIEASGQSTDRNEAYESALDHLAKVIFVQIESKTEITQSDSGSDSFKGLFKSNTDIPLIGAKTRCIDAGRFYECTSALDTDEANIVYKSLLDQSQKDINSMAAQLGSLSDNSLYKQLNKILITYQNYGKYKLVYEFLSGKSIQNEYLAITKNEIETRILALEAEAPTLQIAAQQLTRNVSGDRIYVKPATQVDSYEVTPLASALKKQLDGIIKGTTDPRHAKHVLSGTFSVSASGIQINYELTDSVGEIITANLVKLLPKAYKDYRYESLAPDFEALLHKGYAVSSEFQAEIATNKGIRQLLFKERETVELLVKLNKPGYFYAVGHSNNQESQSSYLLELNEGQGNRKFVYYINADQINKWVSLGEFEVTPPFGTESIQLVASNEDLISQVPTTRYNPSNSLYVISSDIKSGVMKTRALVKKKPAKKTAIKTEAVLMFTTIAAD